MALSVGGDGLGADCERWWGCDCGKEGFGAGADSGVSAVGGEGDGCAGGGDGGTAGDEGLAVYDILA